MKKSLRFAVFNPDAKRPVLLKSHEVEFAKCLVRSTYVSVITRDPVLEWLTLFNRSFQHRNDILHAAE